MKAYLLAIATAFGFAITATASAADVLPVRDGKSCEAPKYPKSALLNEETGTVQMGFLVGVDGKVTES